MVFSYTCSYVTNFVSQLLGTVSLSDSGYSSKNRPAFTSSNVYLVRLIFFVLLGQSDIVAKLCEFSFKVFPAPFLSFAGHIQLSKFLVVLTVSTRYTHVSKECPPAISAFFVPLRSARRLKRSIKNVPFVRDAAHAASTRTVLTCLSPWLVQLLFFFPALSLLPGHIPAQEQRCAEVGKLPISRPISAIKSSHTLSCISGISHIFSTIQE